MKREIRYIVAKYKDVAKYLTDSDQFTLIELIKKIDAGRVSDGKNTLECVCVESDWPEYSEVWDMLASRIDGVSIRQAATTEANKRISELEVQLQNWKDFSKKVQKIDFNDYLQLQASNNHLREALDMLVITKEYKDKQGKDAVYETMRTNAWNVAEQALSATPAESLQAHDNELIEKCAKYLDDNYGFTGKLLSKSIRALKEVK